MVYVTDDGARRQRRRLKKKKADDQVQFQAMEIMVGVSDEKENREIY